MAAPIKRITDAAYQLNRATADTNPHLGAFATGGFFIGGDTALSSPTDFGAYDIQYLADGRLTAAVVTASDSPTSNETAQSGYGLSNGNFAVVWFMGGGHMIADYN